MASRKSKNFTSCCTNTNPQSVIVSTGIKETSKINMNMFIDVSFWKALWLGSLECNNILL